MLINFLYFSQTDRVCRLRGKHFLYFFYETFKITLVKFVVKTDHEISFRKKYGSVYYFFEYFFFRAVIFVQIIRIISCAKFAVKTGVQQQRILKGDVLDMLGNTAA